jgi:hypothetical protein
MSTLTNVSALPAVIPWRLRLARLAAGALIALSAAIFVRGLPGFLAELHRPCVDQACLGGQLAPAQLDGLASLGVRLEAYVAYRAAVIVAHEIVFLAAGLLLFTRRPRDPMALFAGFTLAIQGATNLSAFLGRAPGPWQKPALLINALTFFTLVSIWFIFPDGHFVRRWTRWVAAAFGLLLAAGWLTPALSTERLPPAVSFLMFFILFGSALFAPIYRYRRVSRPLQRQQTKLIVFIIVVILVSQLAFGLAELAVPGIEARLELATLPVEDLLLLGIPAAFVVAMLRYRLYDVDLIIRRTLTYAVLTGLLAAAYLGLVVITEGLLAAATGRSGSALAVVVSTLGLAALFAPLRRRVQTGIDLRLYRRKYNAAQTLARFGAELRDQTDLDTLTRQLVSVVDRTLQPASVSVWLRR